MNQLLPTHRTSTNFATADRPRCMLRDENYLRQRRQIRKIDYGTDEYEQTTWYWNMNHQSNGKKPNQKSKHAQFSSSRSHSSSSGFQSFFRWFKKDEKSRAVSDISYPRDVTSSTDTLEDRQERRFARNAKGRRKLRAYESTDTISPPASPRFSRAFSQSSSCDSIFSTASSFAFVPPVKYLSSRNQKQPETIPDRSYTETYQRRVRARDQARESDKQSEATLRRKYQLYPESSDAETNNNSSKPYKVNQRYQDRSLPSGRKTNLPDSAKLHDLSVSNHRRTSSDSAKDKQAGAYVHVKGKRKAPEPPAVRINPRTLSPKSSLSRKKRPAPKPPTVQEFEGATASSTSLLEDKDIKALIQGISPSQNFSTTSIPLDMERKAYVSPYLKIREDRKLTDEQKRNLIDQVSRNVRKNDEKQKTESPQLTKRSTPDIFTIERGQLVYQGSESPKLPSKEEKIVAPPSPLSPRPWFKRHPPTNPKDYSPAPVKSLEKRKSKNDEKDLSENGNSRHSFFGARFNIFARMGDESKKKERDAEKRKSQIGIPNISELDREAAEIIYEVNRSNMKINASELLMLRSQINSLKEKANEDENRPKSAKDLINKFEADTSHVNRITLNPAYIGRREFFGENMSANLKKKQEESSLKIEEKVETKSKLPLLVKANGIRKSNDLMSLWTCPYCTLQNPNWKIICEACEKIKPYEKRFCANGELIKQNGSSPPKAPKREFSENVWDKKTETVLKYFHPAPVNGLLKSASETTVGKSFKKESPSPGRVTGSPQTNARRNIFKTASENQDSIIEAIEEETVDKTVLASAIVNTKPPMFTLPPMSLDPKVIVVETPNLDEVRSARLAKFNLISNKNRFDYEASNTNRKQSPEKTFPDKLDFSNPVALELEKARLREKIRAMNAKALAERYPVLKKLPENQVKENSIPLTIEPTAPIPSPVSTVEQSKRGAIRKTFKNPFETRRESFEKVKEDEKILNHEDADKREKISTFVQTKVEQRKSPKKSEESIFVPTTVIELAKDEKAVAKDLELTTKQQEEVEVISDQLKSKDGIETFKATLRSKSINKTNTLAINRILRNLENAIADGRYDDAGQHAIDLAKMKVSLSVTRQKDRPKSDVDIDLKNVAVNLIIKDGVNSTKDVLLGISALMTIAEFKKQVEKKFKIPSSSQKLMINEMFANKEDKSLEDFNINNEVFDVVVYKEIGSEKSSAKGNFFNITTRQSSESDDETQNERVGRVDGAAVGGDFNINPKLKIEEDGWECPLCTLINQPNRPGCLACSTTRPISYKVPSHFQEIEYKLKVNEDLRTFFDMENVQLRTPSVKNDLNRQSANRKSSDIFNILVEEKKTVSAPQFTPTEQQTTPTVSSPNITKNKYRGVDNFNPTSYVFPKLSEIRVKPVITSVIYKSSPASAKETVKLNQNHYQELVSLDLSHLASNSEKFECSICFMQIQPRAGAVLRECLHSFCRECLACHIKYSDEAEVKCPFIDDQYSCLCLLQEREIRSLVSKEEYDKHLTRSIRQAENKIENTFHCKTPNCRGWCIFEDTSNIFRCPVCTIVNCLTCGAVHDGINCKQYQDQLNNDADSESARQTKQLLQELIDKEEALNCPTCQIFLLKKWGCDWLKCSFCKTEICWVTRGPRWGPNGKGDTTGGCKCGVGGKKCSSKCNYCH